MKRLDFHSWEFAEFGKEDFLSAQVPGCNYLDLMRHGLLEDPFWGVNEKNSLWPAERDWVYRAVFDVNADILTYDKVEFYAASLDTVAEVYINDKLVLECNNMFREQIINVKEYVIAGQNTIQIVFRSPLKYIERKKEKIKLPTGTYLCAPPQYIRKVQCHFGWDWGPQLPPSGIPGDICIRCYNTAKIEDARLIQEHYDGGVKLHSFVQCTMYNVQRDSEQWAVDSGRLPDKFPSTEWPRSGRGGSLGGTIKIRILITAPDGKVTEENGELIDGVAEFETEIPNPKLWWPQGYGAQPLYSISVSISDDKAELDNKEYKIGLRTIVLDTRKDYYGNQFAFVVNGARIFAKGANWIPADSFSERLTEEKLEYLIKSAADANMNMLRVWGGGYYESDAFYMLCDRYGIFVWQDFAFSCYPYPLNDKDYVNNCLIEVEDNVKRLRHHACLCLWNGNNEIETLSKSWIHRRDLIESTGNFFYNMLRDKVDALDTVTPYWPGSPSSGTYMKKVGKDNAGDTHLWQVWHGLMPIKYYRQRFTRFCSEFGMQSMPSMDTTRMFAAPEDYSLESDVFMNHQKCAGGNEKMIFYVASNYRVPEDFKDMAYLTQLTQAEAMRDPIEHWRRNMGRCNGALYWQHNDCWPVSSWAGIDYGGKWKALNYIAKKCFRPVTLSLSDHKKGVDVYVINDRLQPFKGKLLWRIEDFSGNILSEGKAAAANDAAEVKLHAEIDTRAIKNKEKSVLLAELFDNEEGRIVSRRTLLLLNDKHAELPDPKIKYKVKVNNGVCVIELTADSFARSVMLDIEGVREPFSDNYFDIMAEERISVSVPVGNMPEKEVTAKLSVRSIYGIKPRSSEKDDKKFMKKMLRKPHSILMRIIYKLFA